MTSATSRNLHVPLPAELHERLRAEADRTGRPATAIARDAIASFLEAQRRTARSEAIRAFAQAHRGSELDLDAELEEAGLDHLATEP